MQNMLCVIGAVSGLEEVVWLQGVMEGVPAAKDYQGGFACKLMSKDLGLAAAAAQHCGAKVPMSQEAAKLYQQVQNNSAVFGHQQ